MSISINSQNSIDIWVIDTANQSELAAEYGLLTEQELTRSQCFKDTALGIRWGLFRGAMRTILSEYTGIPAQEIRIDQEPGEKPSIQELETEPRIEFNLSHSDRLALLAINSTYAIGVDLEFCREIPETDSLVRRFFSQSEQAAYFSIEDHLRTEAFYRGWTRKEAVIKAMGLGLKVPLEQFDVPLTHSEDWHAARFKEALSIVDSFYLRQLPLEDGFIGALAIASSDAAKEKLPKVELKPYRFADQAPQ